MDDDRRSSCWEILTFFFIFFFFLSTFFCDSSNFMFFFSYKEENVSHTHTNGHIECPIIIYKKQLYVFNSFHFFFSRKKLIEFDWLICELSYPVCCHHFVCVYVWKLQILKFFNSLIKKKHVNVQSACVNLFFVLFLFCLV